MSASNGVAVLAGCFAALLVILAFGAIGGIAASWVLSYFGVHVPWYVCWVGLALLGGTFRGITYASKA